MHFFAIQWKGQDAHHANFHDTAINIFSCLLEIITGSKQTITKFFLHKKLVEDTEHIYLVPRPNGHGC